jgi:hypothetical protein
LVARHPKSHAYWTLRAEQVMDRVFDNGSESRRQSSTHNRQLDGFVNVTVHEPIQPLAPQVAAQCNRWHTPLPIQSLPMPPIGLTPSESTPISTLSGVMQSPGGLSSAIFQINNASISAEIGESLVSSGWTLASVGTSSAVIRNNGQERTLSVGGVF